MRLASPPSSAPSELKLTVVAVTGFGDAAAAEAKVGVALVTVTAPLSDMAGLPTTAAVTVALPVTPEPGAVYSPPESTAPTPVEVQASE